MFMEDEVQYTCIYDPNNADFIFSKTCSSLKIIVFVTS